MTTPTPVPTTPHTITLRIPSVMPTPPEGYRILEYSLITCWPLIQRETLCGEDAITPSLAGFKVAESYLNDCLALQVVAVNRAGDVVVAECPLGGGAPWPEWE